MPATAQPPWEELTANLRAFIGRRVRNPSDVDDLVQRVFLQILKGLESLRDAERVHAWIHRVARNVIADYYRSPHVRRELTAGAAEDVAGLETTGEAVGEDNAALRELAACLAPMLEQLPPAYREAVTLADLDGVHQAEAARRAGVSLSGMKSRVQRGRKQLRAILEQCCRIHLDRRGGIVAYDRRTPGSCGGCAGG